MNKIGEATTSEKAAAAIQIPLSFSPSLPTTIHFLCFHWTLSRRWLSSRNDRRREEWKLPLVIGKFLFLFLPIICCFDCVDDTREVKISRMALVIFDERFFSLLFWETKEQHEGRKLLNKRVKKFCNKIVLRGSLDGSIILFSR